MRNENKKFARKLMRHTIAIEKCILTKLSKNALWKKVSFEINVLNTI